MLRTHQWLSGPMLAVALSACGGAAPASSSVISSAAPSTAPLASSAAASKPAAAASAKPAGSAAAGGPIKIGVLEPLTGTFSNVAKDNQDGLNMYMEAVNSTMAGRKVQLIYADTEGKADVGLNKAKQLAESDKVAVLMGITATPVALAVAGYVKDAHVPLMITGNGGAQGLTIDPKVKSPYTTRWTQNATLMIDPAADWAYKHGWRKAIIMASDYGAGLENSATFASTFIRRGGSIVQELYPPLGAADFGPYLAQINQSADFIFAFFPGVDGLRFMQQFGNYAAHKLPILDSFGAMTTGSNLPELKDKAVGVIADGVWSFAADTPENQAFLKAWNAKYPGRYAATDAAMGYSAGQILEAALKKINGNAEDAQGFLKALYEVDINTAKGHMKLDADHDIVENVYVYELVAQGDRIDHKLLDTYKDVSKSWTRSPEELAHFPFGTLKGKLVSLTKDQVEQLAKS